MKTYLLTGAGFSANWGGLLAADFINDLLGAPQLDQAARDLLWRHKKEGFEKALSVLQRAGGPSLKLMETAVSEVFRSMNSAFVAQGFTLEFRHGAQAERDDSVLRFLAHFDAIFTLNQDLLLESGYCAQADPPQAFRADRHGYAFPGMIPRAQPAPLGLVPRWCGEFCPDPASTSVAPPDPHTQPIYKLHGSSNWVDDVGERLLIMGGDKVDAIRGSQLLRAYAEEFRRCLGEPDARLMIIGYGFQDHHINSVIETAAANGLKIYIVDPWGIEAPDPMRGRENIIRPAPPVNATQAALIGASTVGLSTIFGGNTVQRKRLLRFFEA
jgi:hypothetical protein